MRILYDLFFLLFSLAYLPTLIFKGKAHRDFKERFGFLPESLTRLEKPVWIHGVSVGEAGVAVRLAAEIKRRFPGTRVVVSTTTRTGNDMANKAGTGVVDGIFYFPLDLTAVVSRVVKKIGPRLYVMIETELWPNLLEELRKNKIPVALANGRLSDRSFGNYMKVKPLMERILRCIDSFCMQTPRDAERIKRLGADERAVNVTGNMKFDENFSTENKGQLDKAYFGFSEDAEVLVAGSTHFPEENAVIDMYNRMRGERPGLKLVIAPRHVERADAVAIYIGKSGRRQVRFSDIAKGARPENVDVVLVDTIGHLKNIYGMATVVFVGGSIAKRGGQNPIEAASRGKPVVFGPNMFNFRQVAEMFLEAGAALQVKDASALGPAIRELLDDAAKRDVMSAAALRVIRENSGAVARTAEMLGKYIQRTAN